jgi:hypothetical protein
MKKAYKILAAALIAMFILCIPAAAAQKTADNQNDIVRIKGDIYVNDGTTVNGDAVTIKGNIYINGSVTGDVVAVFGDVIVNGEVMGDVTTVSGEIKLGPNGKILGDRVQAFGGPLGGNNNFGFRTIPPIWPGAWSGVGNTVFSLVFALVLFLLSALVYLIIPQKVTDMADAIDNNIGRRIGIGFLTLICSPIVVIVLTILLAITVIGIIVIPFLWIAYLIAGLVAITPVYVYIGGKAGELISKRKITGYSALAAGLLNVWLIKRIIELGSSNMGWISAIISLLVLALGFGTLLDYIFTRRRAGSNHNDSSGHRPEGGSREASNGDSHGEDFSGNGSSSQDAQDSNNESIEHKDN